MLETMDAMFLDCTAKVIEINISDTLLRHSCKFHSVYNEAWRSVGKRIESKV